MASVLDIARNVADDISLDWPVSLYGPPGHEEGDTTARRLRRAIEATCHYLLATHSWQQSKREHTFLTVAGERQPGAIPVDFLRFIDGTIIDAGSKLPLRMADSDADWKQARLFGTSGFPPRWIRQGGDILIYPSATAGQTLGYSYISSAIATEPAQPWDVIKTTNGMTLEPGKRYIVQAGHTVVLPRTMGLAGSLELVPQGGEWRNLSASFTSGDGSNIVNFSPVDHRDWVSVTKVTDYEFRPVIGGWLDISTPTIDGMTLEANHRYMVKQGHRVEFPILGAGDFIELVPDIGTWSSHGSKFTTRDGLTIAPPLVDAAIVTITADMAKSPQYTMTPGNTTAQIWGKGRIKSQLTTDRDVPLWDAELITLGAIWRMQYRDGNQYTEEFRAFQRMIYDRLKGSEGYGKIDMQGSGDGWPGKSGRPLRPRISGMMV
jgi:hypothetical protein